MVRLASYEDEASLGSLFEGKKSSVFKLKLLSPLSHPTSCMSERELSEVERHLLLVEQLSLTFTYLCNYSYLVGSFSKRLLSSSEPRVRA